MVASHIPMLSWDLSRNMVAPEFLWQGPIYACANLPIDPLINRQNIYGPAIVQPTYVPLYKCNEGLNTRFRHINIHVGPHMVEKCIFHGTTLLPYTLLMVTPHQFRTDDDVYFPHLRLCNHKLCY
jgi:hypothetical protein